MSSFNVGIRRLAYPGFLSALTTSPSHSLQMAAQSSPTKPSLRSLPPTSGPCQPSAGPMVLQGTRAALPLAPHARTSIPMNGCGGAALVHSATESAGFHQSTGPIIMVGAQCPRGDTLLRFVHRTGVWFCSTLHVASRILLPRAHLSQNFQRYLCNPCIALESSGTHSMCIDWRIYASRK